MHVDRTRYGTAMNGSPQRRPVVHAPPVGCPQKPAERPQVLITDDDAPLRETLRDALESQGFRTCLAGNGEQALQIVRSNPVHLAILDVHMPRLTGLETIRQMRELGLELPCILISANLDEQLRREAETARVFSLLSKPVSRAELAGSVRLALEQTYRWSPRRASN